MLKKPSDLETFQESRQLAVRGLNTVDDPSDIDIKNSPDMQNVVFDSGLVSPRKGSRLYAEKPVSESNDPLQSMTVSNSIGEKFLVTIYGNNFYYRDEVNDYWVKLNNTYTPTELTLFYGYVPWNNGLGDDTLYACNGKESFVKWSIYQQELADDAFAGNTSITIDDAVPLPSTGDVVLFDGSSYVYTSYSSKLGNVLTLTAPLSGDMGSGATVVSQLIEVAGMEKGKYVITYNRRIVVSNAYQQEVKVSYSKQNDPEDFSAPGSSPGDPGTFNLNDGNGQITALGDFGEYVLITKEDNMVRFEITINDAGDVQFEKITPLISGKAMGPKADSASIKILNSVYYVTPSKDIYQISPTQTGASSTSGLSNVSSPIYNYLKTLTFDKTRTAYNDQKIMWACGTGEVNNLVLVYDLIRNAWTKFLGWNAQDIFSKGNTSYYLDRTSGNIYSILSDYDDDGSSYKSYYFTKRLSFGKSSMPKTADAIYVEGYITSSTNLFAKVLFNERGSLKSETYKISGTGEYVTQVSVGALGQYPMGVVPLGLTASGGIGIFHVYLSIPNMYGFYNIQVMFYSEKAGSIWAVSGISINPTADPNIPATLRLDSINAVNIQA